VFRLALLLLLLPSVLSASHPNVLLITIDTLRADHLGCYGDRTIRTPNLDALAADSLFFENAICEAPLTLPSHTSLLTGRYPFHHGVHDNAGTLNTSVTTLAEILRAHGYHTYAFVGGFPLDHRFGLNQGFNVYDDSFPREKNRPLDFRSERSADRVVAVLHSAKIKPPFFIWVHFYDPHAPYLHGGYDGEIEFVDQQIPALLKSFDRKNLIVAVAGDHGESLGEHGEFTHRIFIYDATIHVPFWISGPGIQPQKVKGQARLIDFFPTILSLLGISIPNGLDGAALPAGTGKPAFLESMFPKLQLGWSSLTGVRTAEWKLIDAPHPELYDLQKDPEEKQNVYSNHPEVVRALRAQLPSAKEITNNKATVSPEMAEQLASLGYVSGGTAAKESRIDPKDKIAVWNQIEKAVDLEQQNSQQTIAILEQARKTDPENPMVLGFLAQKLGEANQIGEARKVLEEVLKRDPANTLALYRIAVLSLKADQPSEALRWANALRIADASSSDAFILLARANLKLHEPAEAAANLQQALRIDPSDLETRNDLANLYLQTNQRSKAEQEFSSVLKRDPRNIQALNGMATFLFMKNDFSSAEAKLNTALRFAPSDAQTKLNLALIYLKTGRRQQAVALYREVAESDQTPADWKAEAQTRLRELQ
jgi:choline-sulfatase